MPEPLLFRCRHCGKGLSALPQDRGKAVACPGCGRQLRVPGRNVVLPLALGLLGGVMAAAITVLGIAWAGWWPGNGPAPPQGSPSAEAKGPPSPTRSPSTLAVPDNTTPPPEPTPPGASAPVREFRDHPNACCLALSADGRRALCGEKDGEIRLWDTRDGKEVRRLRGHRGRVWNVVFTPDGGHALSAGQDTTLRLWDLETGRERRRFAGHTAGAIGLALSPDGRIAVSGGGDCTLRQWDMATGKQARLFPGLVGSAMSVAFSADGQFVLTGGAVLDEDYRPLLCSLRLWDVKAGKEVRTFAGHTDMVRSVALSPDGRHALSGAQDGTAWLWDVASGRRLRRLGEAERSVMAVAFTPDGRRALTAGAGAVLSLWDVDTGALRHRFEGHTGFVESVALSADGRRLLSAGEDRVVRLWDIPGPGKPLHPLVRRPAVVGPASPQPEPAPPADEVARAKEALQRMISFQRRRAAGQTAEAIDDAKQAHALAAPIYGAGHDYVLSLYAVVADLHLHRDEFPQARAAWERVREMALRERGKSSYWVADATRGLADVERIARLDRADRDRLREARLLAWQGWFAGAKDPTEPRKRTQRALAASRAVLGENHPTTARALWIVGGLLMRPWPDLEARMCLDYALAIQKKALGPDHPETLDTLSDLAEFQEMQGDQVAAGNNYERVLAGRKVMLSPDNVTIADILVRLGAFRKAQGEHAKARGLLEEAVRIYRLQRPYRTHPHLGAAVAELGALELAQGNIAAAQAYGREAKTELEEAGGKEGPASAMALNLLGALAEELGDLETATKYHEQALARAYKALGEYHPITARCLHHLGQVQRKKGEYESAKAEFGRSLLARSMHREGKTLVAVIPAKNKVPNFFPLEWAETYHAQGVVRRQLGELVDAQDCLERALIVRKKVLGNKHHLTGETYRELGLLLAERGRLPEARQHLDHALTASLEPLGENHPQTLAVRRDLFRLCGRMGRWQEALDVADACQRGLCNYLSRGLRDLHEAEQLRFLGQWNADVLPSALSLALARPKDRLAAERSAAWVLNARGMSLQSLAERLRLARDFRDRNTGELLDQLIVVRSRLASLRLQSSASASAEGKEALTRLSNQEYELSRRLAKAQKHLDLGGPWVELAAAQKSLPKEAVLVELARFRAWDFARGKFGDARYVAWVIPPAGKGTVQVIDLGPAERIDAAVRAWRRAIEAAGGRTGSIFLHGEKEAEAEVRKPLEALARLVLVPLGPALAKAEHWVIGPDADLWLVPWAALPLPDDSYAVEKHRITLVISGRELVSRGYKPAPTSAALVLGDPDFDLGKGAKRPPAPKGRDVVPQTWSRLPGTAVELRHVVPRLAAYLGSKPTVHLGGRARKSALLKADRPRVVVLSTHGFFLEDQAPKKEAWAVEARPAPDVLSNPLLRCGLVFAGANRRSAEEGIATGLEIVGIDLRGTELVVLSACDTGLGDVRTGEGVAGLRQAFQLAGARAVVATLWKVPDRETAQLMGAFWDNLAARQAKTDALRNAQLAVIKAHRDRGKAAHPYFWAAFTLTGQWR